jgi:hypothetical protein
MNEQEINVSLKEVVKTQFGIVASQLRQKLRHEQCRHDWIRRVNQHYQSTRAYRNLSR